MLPLPANRSFCSSLVFPTCVSPAFATGVGLRHPLFSALFPARPHLGRLTLLAISFLCQLDLQRFEILANLPRRCPVVARVERHRCSVTQHGQHSATFILVVSVLSSSRSHFLVKVDLDLHHFPVDSLVFFDLECTVAFT